MSDLDATLAAVHRHGGRLRWREGAVRLIGLDHAGLRLALIEHRPALVEGVDASGPTRPCPMCQSPSYWREVEADSWRCAECEPWPHDAVQTLVVGGGQRRTTGAWAGDRALVEARRQANRETMPGVSGFVDRLRAAIESVAVTHAAEGGAEQGTPQPPDPARTVLHPGGRPRAMTQKEASGW